MPFVSQASCSPVRALIYKGFYVEKSPQAPQQQHHVPLVKNMSLYIYAASSFKCYTREKHLIIATNVHVKDWLDGWFIWGQGIIYCGCGWVTWRLVAGNLLLLSLAEITSQCRDLLLWGFSGKHGKKSVRSPDVTTTVYFCLP